MKIIKAIESWSVTITVILVIIVWFLLMRFVLIGLEARMVGIFWYSYFVAIALWAILSRVVIKNEDKVKNYLKIKYPLSRPFESNPEGSDLSFIVERTDCN